MKKIILLVAAIALFGANQVTAQEVAKTKAVKTKIAKTKKGAFTPEVQGPSIKFTSEVIDYGTIEKNANGERAFEFVNNGSEPLIITSASGSCGCTVPSFPKEPIMPGTKAVIGVKYATDRVGAFTKTVTVTSNAKDAASKVLTIKGTVNPEPAAATKS